MPYSNAKATEIGEYCVENGKAKTREKYGMSASTLSNVNRIYRRITAENAEKEDPIKTSDAVLLRKIRDRFTDAEIRTLISGHSLNPDAGEKPTINFSGDVVTVTYVTDTHWGAKHSPDSYWDSMLKESERVGSSMIIHGGDVVEGMNSSRGDHVYSLRPDGIGWTAQKRLAIRNFQKSNLPIHVVSGNHDLWGMRDGGNSVVEEICDRLDHVTFLGNDSGVVSINGTDWMVWHGHDGGGSYAVSYRIQKIIEAFKGGEKPHVLLTGHDHKQCYIFNRNVHAVAGGALCQQGFWMKATRKANEDGFWIIKACIESGEIKWFEPRFYPFY